MQNSFSMEEEYKELTPYKAAYEKLKNYRQKQLFGRLVKGTMVYEGIEVHANGIVLAISLIQIKELLKNFNFKITGYKEKITIQ